MTNNIAPEMFICVYCDTMSNFPQGYCEDCQEYDGIVTLVAADFDDDDESYIDYYMEASLFGWEN